MPRDPILAEVHRIRAAMWDECGRDFGKLGELQREALERWRGKVVTKADLDRERAATEPQDD